MYNSLTALLVLALWIAPIPITAAMMTIAPWWVASSVGLAWLFAVAVGFHGKNGLE